MKSSPLSWWLKKFCFGISCPIEDPPFVFLRKGFSVAQFYSRCAPFQVLIEGMPNGNKLENKRYKCCHFSHAVSPKVCARLQLRAPLVRFMAFINNKAPRVSQENNSQVVLCKLSKIKSEEKLSKSCDCKLLLLFNLLGSS